MNKITLQGKVTRKTEIKYTIKQTPFANLNIYEEDNKTFLDINLWEQLALDSNELDKDDVVSIEGYVRKRSYEDKNKKKVYVTEIIATSYEVVGNVPRETNDDEVIPYSFAETKEEVDPFADFGETVELTEDDIAF